MNSIKVYPSVSYETTVDGVACKLTFTRMDNVLMERIQKRRRTTVCELDVDSRVLPIAREIAYFNPKDGAFSVQEGQKRALRKVLKSIGSAFPELCEPIWNLWASKQAKQTHKAAVKEAEYRYFSAGK